MKTKIFILLGFIFCLGLVKPSEAQYLKVKSKKAKIRTVAALNGNVVEVVTKGTILIILQEAKSSTNNYYKVKCSLNNCEGWIARTAVKRIKGEIPDEIFNENKIATDLFGMGQIPVGYYDNTEELSGPSLKHQLHLLTRNHKRFTYSEIFTILETTDQDPYDTLNIVLFYTSKSVHRKYKDRGGRYDYKLNGYTYQDAWNREHVWPKSFGFPNESDTAYTDLHHIRPADRTINSQRNNRSFDYGTMPYHDNDGTVITECFISENWTWEPPDFVKGDIARMIFYMAIRYEGYDTNGEKDGDLEVVDEILPKNSKKPQMGKLTTLLDWHKLDPVDNWERSRNDIIFKKYQGNRNPFIDHPEFVSKIWPD